MPTRIALRRVGEPTGKKAALPATMSELLELATKKLELSTPAQRIFSEQGDEYDAEDIGLIGVDDVLYVSCGEAFATRAAAEFAPTAPAPPAASSVLGASGTEMVATPLTRFDKNSLRRQVLQKRAEPLTRVAKDALALTHDLRVGDDIEAEPSRVQMSETSVLKAVEEAIDAHSEYLRGQLSIQGSQLKIGRGGTYKGPKSGERDVIERGKISVVRPESDTGSHNTNEGCLPGLTRIILIGDCHHGDWVRRTSTFEDDIGFLWADAKGREAWRAVPQAHLWRGEDQELRRWPQWPRAVRAAPLSLHQRL